MTIRPTAHEVIRRALVTPLAAPWTGTAEAAAIVQALTDAGLLLPPWTCHDGHGRRYQIIETSRHAAGTVGDDPLIHARLLPVDVDSAGDPVGGGEGDGT